jgi:hypothetical protein
VLKEATKFPKQRFWNGTFDRWLHKVTFWSQVNVFPSETLNFLYLKWLKTHIQHFVTGGGGGGVETIVCHNYYLSIQVFKFEDLPTLSKYI